jgi:hypothetical protein
VARRSGKRCCTKNAVSHQNEIALSDIPDMRYCEHAKVVASSMKLCCIVEAGCSALTICDVDFTSSQRLETKSLHLSGGECGCSAKVGYM